MALKIVIGAAGTGKSKYVADIVRREAAESLSRKCYMIVPDQFTLQTQINMVRQSECGGIMNIDVLSFSRLAYRVFEETNQGKQPVLDDTGKSLILRKLAGDIKEKIPYLAGNLDRIGFIHEVKSAISEFMQYGIGTEEMENLIAYSQRKGLLKSKLTDLSVLYSAFMDYLGDQYITKEESMDILSRALDSSSLMKDSICVFDGFTGFTPVQIRVLEVLVRQCRDVYITLTIDADTDVNLIKEQSLFGFTVKSYQTLAKMASRVNVKYETIRLEHNYRYENLPDMAALERRIFRYNQPAYTAEADNIEVSCHTDVDGEIRQLCAKIRELVSSNKAQYRDIAVVTGNTNAYEYRMRRLLAQYDIPVFWDKTRGIVLNSFVEYTKSVLQIMERDYSIDSVMRYLRSGMCDISLEKVDVFENYIHKKGIRGKKRYSSVFVCLNDEEMTKTVNEVREYINSSLADFDKIDKNSSVRDYVNSLYDFYRNNNCYEKLEDYSTLFEERGDYSMAAEYSQIYVETLKLLEQIYDLLGDENMEMEEFCNILEAGFGEIRIGSIPLSVDRILVGDLQRTRLKDVKYLFVLGMDDGNIPGNGGAPGIISDMEREYLSTSEYELAPTVREKLYIERFYLYSMLTKPSAGLYLSYSLTDTESKSVSPSYVIDMITSIFPEVETRIEPGSSQGVLEVNNIYELKENVGRNIRRISEGEQNDSLYDELITGIEALYRLGRDGREYIAWCIANSFYEYRGGRLDAKIAGILYGSTMLASISRMEQFSRCAYAYFLKYGLGIEEREEREFDSRDMGLVYHGVMEAFGRRMNEEGLNWYDIDEDRIREIIDEEIERHAIENDSKLFESGANQYIYGRMKKIMYKAVETFAYHLMQGKYQVEGLEVGFVRMQELDAVNQATGEQQKMKLNGRIDRIDTYVDENRVYVKVVDYKTSEKTFSLMDFYLGTQLQLVVYLDEGLKAAARLHEGREAVPAAMLYCKLSDSVVDAGDAESEDDINQKIIKTMKAKGIINSEDGIVDSLTDMSSGKSDVVQVSLNKDGSYSKGSQVATRATLDLLSRYADYKLKSIGTQLIEGKMDKNPVKTSDKESCKYCEYKDVCGFDSRKPGYRMEVIKSMDDKDVLDKIIEVLGESQQEGD